MITLAVYKGWRWRPRYLVQDGAIRLVTWSRYSHVEFVAGRAELGGTYECWSSSARRGGVSRARITLHPKRWDLAYLARDPKPALARLKAIDGAPYDWFGALFSALPFGPVNNPEAWFCSEACAHAVTGFRDTPSPGELAQTLGLSPQ
ncbi:MAG: hypothetical protein AAF330_04195 [Pseudomonadota bacterium]